MTGRAPLLLVCITVVLGGCAVGPDFGRPPAPPVDRYTADPARVTLAPGGDEPAQRLVVGHAISAQWWELFGSRPLVDAVDLALAGSPTLAAAEATLAQGEEAVTVARAAFYPHVDLTGSATRQHRSSSAEGGGGGTFNLFSLGPSVSYSPDVFGGTRRHVEQAGAQAESQRDELAAAYLALTGNVVSQAIAVAGARLE